MKKGCHCETDKPQKCFPWFREMKSGQDSILHFKLQKVCLSDREVFYLSWLNLKQKDILPLLINFKTNPQAHLSDRYRENMSEGESNLIQIFLFNLRLLVVVATQWYSRTWKKDEWHFYGVIYLIHQCSDSSELKYMVPLTVFYCVHSLNKNIRCALFEHHKAVGYSLMSVHSLEAVVGTSAI